MFKRLLSRVLFSSTLIVGGHLAYRISTQYEKEGMVKNVFTEPTYFGTKHQLELDTSSTIFNLNPPLIERSLGMLNGPDVLSGDHVLIYGYGLNYPQFGLSRRITYITDMPK